MEPLSNLLYLLEPAAILLIVTACSVVFLAAQRSYLHNRESERHKDLQEQSITLDSRQALLIPVASSCSLLVMFYLFSRVSGIITGEHNLLLFGYSLGLLFLGGVEAKACGLLNKQEECGHIYPPSCKLSSSQANVVLMRLLHEGNCGL
jgi:hypothetical protein